MDLIPRELDMGGIYWPPLVVAFMLGVVAMGITCHLLNRYRLSRYFIFPQVVMVAITCIYTVLLSTFVFPT